MGIWPKNSNIFVQDTGGRNALMWASDCNHEAAVVALLKLCDEETINVVDTNFESALIIAVKKKDVKIVSMLLKTKGINVNLKDRKGITALMWASEYNLKSIAQELLNTSDIDVSLKDNEGKTALNHAVNSGSKDVSLLLA